MTLLGPTSAPLAISLLGPFSIHVNGAPLPRLRSRKQEAILALLTLRHGRPVERAWLAGLLWPDSSESQGLATLRRYLTTLRQLLGPEASRLRSPTAATLSLDLPGARVDLIAFETAIARGDPQSLEAAVSLYRGPLLEGWAEEWVSEERSCREQAYLEALETLAAAARAGGNLRGAERHLRRAVAVDPLRESAQRALLEALAASGNYAAVIQSYRELRERLHRELNAEPDPETQALFQQLRSAARSKAALGSGLWALGKDGGRSSGRRAVALPAQSPEPRAQSESEATLTFLFTDIEGSTRLWEQHPQPMRAALDRHDALLRQAIETHRGQVFKTMGDQICAAFPTAPDALRAALAAQQALHVERWPLPSAMRVRMALHTGTAQERGGDYVGPPLNRVARLLAAAHGGQVLLSQTTAELARDQLPEAADLRDLGEQRLKDLMRPEHIFQLVAPPLPTDFPPVRSLRVFAQNLPLPLTRLIGREAQLAEVKRLLGEVRLVTLTGAGGCGKTQLAIQVAADLLDGFADGVFFVALAPISDPGLVASTIAETLGVREAADTSLTESLKDDLRAKQMLLLLDNFEQVLAAAPLVAELLTAAPRVNVLVTSRAALRLRGEQEFPVPPLPVPDPKRLPPLPALSRYGAVELFVQRAVNVRPDFALTDENATAVAKICHRLDGLPLAIELAAARIKVLSPHVLLSRLESRLKVLTGGARDLPARQQTLRDTIAWSYGLLDEDEKRLFRRLSVFVGGCTLEAVEAVCALEDDAILDALDGLGSMINQSLLQQQENAGGEPRFTMLETIREFGSECLVSSGEADAVRRRHAWFYLALAEQAEPQLHGPQQREWVERLEAEHGNLQASLTWSLERGEIEVGLRLGGSLWQYWPMRGHISEGRERLMRLLAQTATAAPSPAERAARAKALCAAAYLATIQGDLAATRALYEESLAIRRELGHKADIAHTLIWLVLAVRRQGEYALARALSEESLALARETGDRSRMAFSLRNLAAVARDLGEYNAARAIYEQSRALYQELGDRHYMAFALDGLADVARSEGNGAVARTLLEESLAIRRELEDNHCIPFSLLGLGNLATDEGEYPAARVLYQEGLELLRGLGVKLRITEYLEGVARLAAAEGQRERAATLWGVSEALREAMGAPLPPAERASYDRTVATARATMGEQLFAAAWTARRAMSLDAAIQYALED